MALFAEIVSEAAIHAVFYFVDALARQGFYRFPNCLGVVFGKVLLGYDEPVSRGKGLDLYDEPFGAVCRKVSSTQIAAVRYRHGFFSLSG